MTAPALPKCRACGVDLATWDTKVGEFKASAEGRTFLCSPCRNRARDELLQRAARIAFVQSQARELSRRKA